MGVQKNAKYKVWNGTDYDTIHFETNYDQIVGEKPYEIFGRDGGTKGNPSNFGLRETGVYNINAMKDATPPYGDANTQLYGTLENFNYDNGRYTLQRFTDTEGRMFVRIYNTAIGQYWGDWTHYLDGRNFELSNNITGYQKLSSGLILQWGTTTVNIGNRQEKRINITFPIMFWNQYLVIASVVKNKTNNNTDWVTSIQANLIKYSQSTAILTVSDIIGVDKNYDFEIQWFVIGTV